jgi:hypothetical protein
MPWICFAPAVAAVVLNLGSGAILLVVSIANAVLAFFSINTMLNLGTQRKTGDIADVASWERYKQSAVAVWTLTLLASIALIIVGIAS